MNRIGDPPISDVNADSFRHQARRALLTEPAVQPAGTPVIASPSDFDLNPEAAADATFETAQRPAAVLVPVVARRDLTLLFTQRTDHLPSHAGQISFPGGKIDGTETVLEAALREAEEEIGLDPGLAEPIGYLDAYRTGTGFRIVPVVALVRPEFTLSLNRGEVASTFEVPLQFLMDRANFRTDVRIIGGKERSFYAIPYGERYIWGATAGILMNMLKRFTAP